MKSIPYDIGIVPMSIIFLVLSFLANYYLIDKIRDIVIFKQLLDDPNERSSHKTSIPNLAGVSFFIAFMLGVYFLEPYDNNQIVFSLIPGLTILFVTGLKDDLLILSPISKLLAQTVAAAFLVFHPEFIIKSFHGFMGVESIYPPIAIALAILIIVTIINAINLIDGIDGLASTVGIIIFSVFAALFYLLELHVLLLIASMMVGGLIAFLRYNLSKDKKIFMGDTGSMILGFMIGAMAIFFLSVDYTDIKKLPFRLRNLPFVVIAILIIPLFDLLRVFFLRIKKGKSPFLADRNHIHHVLIDRFQISHRRTSFIVGVVNFLAIVVFSILAMRTDHIILSLMFASFIAIAVLFFFLLHDPDKLRRMRLRTKITYLKFIKKTSNKSKLKPKKNKNKNAKKSFEEG